MSSRAVRSLHLMIGLVALAVSARGACQPPHYRIGRAFPDGSPDLTISISVRFEDLAPDRLLCLASALKQQHPKGNILVTVFPLFAAARGYSPGSVDPPIVREHELKAHALYVYNKDQHEDRLTIMPQGQRYASRRFDTQIDLPATGKPVCKLAINGRCLLEFRPIFYDSRAGHPGVTGKVTISGKIKRNGTMADLAIADAKTEPAASQPAVAASAIRNLRTWRFEPGPHDDAVRITYSFEVDVTTPVEADSGMFFRSAEEVTVATGHRN